MENMYDISDIPIKKYSGKICRDWKNSIGHKIKTNVNEKSIEYTIISYDPKTGEVELKHNDEIHKINKYIFKNNRKNVAITGISKEHIYNINDSVNGYLILEQLRIPSPNHNKTSTVKGYKVKCLKCGYELILSENGLIRKNEGYCKYCAPKCIKGINDMWTTNPSMAKLLKTKEDGYKYKDNYTMKKLEWVCPDCNNIIFESPNYIKKHGIICKKCSDKVSKPEKIMFNVLLQCGINFNTHITLPIKSFTFNNKPYIPIYDFYFFKDGTNYLIEMDGGFHFKTHGKSKYTIDDIRLIDSKKDELAKINEYHLIRIKAEPSDFEFIYENIIKSKLKDILDFSKLDKNYALRYSSSNRIKEVCEFYNTINKDLNIISENMKISYNTIYKYLLTGRKLGWTDYNPSTQNKKMSFKNIPQYSIICNEKSIIFKDVNSLEQNSTVILGISISKDKITRYFCNNYGDIDGYTFTRIPYKQSMEIEKILPDIVI